MASWLQMLDFYCYNCYNNYDFLEKIKHYSLVNNYTNPYEEIIKNVDMVQSSNQCNELVEIYKNKILVSFRSGNVESRFVLKYKFDMNPNNIDYFKLNNIANDNIDIEMKRHAGLYYKDEKQRMDVLYFYCDNYIELHKNCILTPAYCFLDNDILLWTKLNLKGIFYNYDILYKVILENSERKKILYLGNAVDSIKTGFERGLQSVWNFPISNFSMYYLQTPQTTLGMEYPHDTYIESCYDIINEIEQKYSDFDTAIFGCGAYGSTLINILRKKYPNKHLLYLGSDCFKMFGIKINLQPWELYNEYVNKDKLIDIVETLPDGCINHPEKKYWKL